MTVMKMTWESRLPQMIFIASASRKELNKAKSCLTLTRERKIFSFLYYVPFKSNKFALVQNVFLKLCVLRTILYLLLLVEFADYPYNYHHMPLSALYSCHESSS